MMPTPLIFAALSILLVGAYCYLARWRGWVDAPTARSSHKNAIPRGAGIVIATLTMLAGALNATHQSAFCLSLLPGLAIAAIGWWDDLRNLPAAPRFVLYWFCSLLALLPMTNWHTATPFDVLLLFAISFGLLWSINLYNFMDGINGLAAFEAIFVLGSSLALSPNSPYSELLKPLICCIIGVLIGFLIWNFPVAKVFMGDAGSAFLGFLIGLLALWSSSLHGPSVAVWLILLGVFIADASYTLVVRICTGQRWYQAHRSHAYQRLNQMLGSHSKTVASLMGVNIAWLFPWAWALHHNWTATSTALMAAYVPLLAICYALKAGNLARTGV